MCLWGILRQQTPRSACAPMQSDQGLCCLFSDSLDTVENVNLIRYVASLADLLQFAHENLPRTL